MAAITTQSAPAPIKRNGLTSVKRPQVAWPTVLLCVAVLASWGSVAAVAVAGLVPLWLAAPLMAVLAYGSFTPMHDSAHRSVSRVRWLNAIMGRLCALVLMAPFPAFRWAHLRHHSKTNEDHHDPDMWSGGGRRWTLPLRWATQDLHYYVCYVRFWSKRPVAERVETVATILVLIGLISAAVWAGYGLEVLLLWALPTRLALTFLAFSFDYLPHHPHGVTSSQDRYRATSVFKELWLTPLFLYQNYHLIHHLHPGVPFYQYGKVWKERQAQLLAKGVRPRSIFEGWGKDSQSE